MQPASQRPALSGTGEARDSSCGNGPRLQPQEVFVARSSANAFEMGKTRSLHPRRKWLLPKRRFVIEVTFGADSPRAAATGVPSAAGRARARARMGPRLTHLTTLARFPCSLGL